MSVFSFVKTIFAPPEQKAASVTIVRRNEVGRPVRSDWDAEQAITDGLKASTWVYASNRYIASKISPIPWYVEAKQADGTWLRVPDHQGEQLLNSPNELMSGQDLRERWLYNLGLAGNALNLMTIVRGQPVEIWPLFPQTVKPVPSAQGPVLRYELNLGAGKRDLKPEEVIHFQYIDPSNLYWGMSPLQAAALVVDTDVEAVRWNASAVANRAKKDYAFIPENPMTKQQWEEARKQLRDQHQGAENAGGFFLGAMPGTLEEMGMTPREMDYIASRGVNKDEIIAAYGLVPILLDGKGILRNYETAVRQFWEDTAISILDDLRDELNRSVMPYFDPGRREPGSGEANASLRYTYDISHIAALHEGLSDKIKQALDLLALGYPINEINKRLDLGMEDVEGGDVPASAPAVTAGLKGPALVKDLGTVLDWDVEWKRFDDTRVKWERQVERQISGLFDMDNESVTGAYRQLGAEGAIRAINESAIEWEEYMRVMYRETITFFGNAEYERLSGLVTAQNAGWKPTLEAKDFNPLSAFIDSWVMQYAAKKVSLITESTRSVIANIIGKGVENDLSTDEIARLIRSQYDEWAALSPEVGEGDLNRSYRIARTETGAAAGFAQNEGARQIAAETGLVVRKRWVSSRDSRVRDSHNAVDGEIVNLNALFSNGLSHPGDPAGPAREVVNCRCVATNIITRS